MQNLPTEIVIKILTRQEIINADLQLFRLVSKQFSRLATPLLFSRICISKLNSDRDSFFNIAAQPHLATLVQTVAWLEMAEDDTAFAYVTPQGDRVDEPVDVRVSPVEDDWDADFFSSLRRSARALFWLPFEDLQMYRDEPSKMQDKKERVERRAKAIDAFTPKFFAALDKMPNLKAFTSQPMPPLREFIKPSKLSVSQYPFTSPMFLRAACKRWSQQNDGFCTFMMPYIAYRADLDTLAPITGLRLVDEHTYSFIPRLDQSFAKSFEGLLCLDLCISNPQSSKHLRALGQCLKPATSLEELRLCFERYNELSRFQQYILYYLFPSHSQYPRLRFLQIVGIPFTPRSLIRLITKVAGSLKSLRFEDCLVTMDLLDSLSKIRDLQLEHFISISDKGPQTKDDDWDVLCILLTEEHVLNILNNKAPCFPISPESENPVIYTHYSASALPGWTKASYFDSHHVTARHLNEDVLQLEMEQSSNYDNEDYDGVEWREEVDMMEIQEPRRTDGKLANVRPCLLENNDRSYSDDSSSSSDLRRWAIAEASVQEMLDSGPRWSWDTRADGMVCYWKVTSENPPRKSHPTTIWQFFHRNGEQALGRDPFEIWDDWEGSQSGDCYEATPFGQDFDYFVVLHGFRRMHLPELPQDWEERDMGNLLAEEAEDLEYPSRQHVFCDTVHP